MGGRLSAGAPIKVATVRGKGYLGGHQRLRGDHRNQFANRIQRRLDFRLLASQLEDAIVNVDVAAGVRLPFPKRQIKKGRGDSCDS